MAHALLWIESLVTALLWVAALYTLSTRVTGRTARLALRGLGLGLPLLFGAALVTGSVALINWRVSTHHLPVTAGWLIATVVGGWLIRRRALRQAPSAASTAVTFDAASAPRSITAARWSPSFTVAAFGVAAGLTLITFWTVDAHVRSQLALLRTESTALSLAIAPEPVPDAENAALLYDQAVSTMVPWDEEEELAERFDKWLDDDTDPAAFADDAELAAFLDGQQPAIRLLHRAAAMPRYYRERGYGRPDVDLVIPDVVESLQLSKLLAVDARYRAVTGDGGAAVADLITLRRYSTHVASDPVLLSLLVGIAIREQEFHVLPEVLAMELTDEQLTRLGDMPLLSGRRMMQRASQLEEAFGLGVFADLGSGRLAGPNVFTAGPESGPNPLWQMALPMWRVFQMPGDLAAYRRIMSTHRAVAAYRTSDKSAQQEFERLQDLEDQLGSAPPGLVTAMLTPAISHLHVTSTNLDVIDQLERAAIAVARYRLATDRDPDSLAALVPDYLPAAPLDPWSGDPLRLTTVGDDGTVVLYSVGQDRTDNGGEIVPDGEWYDDGTDVAIALPARR